MGKKHGRWHSGASMSRAKPARPVTVRQARDDQDAPPGGGGAQRLPLAVYDGLRAGESTWQRVLSGHTRAIRPGRALDQALYAQGLPFALDQEGATIVVDVMTLWPETYDETIARVDDVQLYTEGVAPILYERTERFVLCEGDTEPIRCWMYQAAPCIRAHLHADEIVESGDWLNLLLRPTSASSPARERTAGTARPVGSSVTRSSQGSGRRASARSIDPPDHGVFGAGAVIAPGTGRDARYSWTPSGSGTTARSSFGTTATPRRTWYFAFGSNLDREQMERRTGPIIERLPAHVDGWELVFNKEAIDGEAGYANIVRAAGGRVEGLLYRVDEAGMRKLDAAEGVLGKHYIRVDLPVTRNDTGELVPSVVYLAHPLRVVAGLRPRRGYLARMLAGAE